MPDPSPIPRTPDLTAPRGARVSQRNRRSGRVILGLLGFFVVLLLARPAAASGPSALGAGAVRFDPVAATVTARDELTPAKAVLLGVVEGLTEFLPISSSGHLLITQSLVGVGATPETKDAADAYAIVIQAGAILAVLLIYWQRLITVGKGVLGQDDEGRKLGINLVVGFLPAAIVGVALEKTIKAHLFGPWPIVAAWIAGGIALLVLSTSGWWEREKHGYGLAELAVKNALIIGVVQCLAMWPGTSRSLVTIVAGLVVGLSISAAVEFSFLLGLLTLGAATVYDAAKHGKDIINNFGVASPLIGFVAALVAGFVAVKWMVGYLQSHSLAIFGWYRLTIAGLAIILILTGHL